MDPINEDTVRKAVELLREAAPGATIILFGSWARGGADEHSDLDFMVVEPVVKSDWDEEVRLYDALRPLRVSVDILVVSKEVFDYWADTPNTVYHEAATKGRVYDAVP